MLLSRSQMYTQQFRKRRRKWRAETSLNIRLQGLIEAWGDFLFFFPFFLVMLCSSCSGGNYEAAWYHSRSIEDSSVNQYFSIHDAQTELLTVHSAGQVKRTKLPCVLLSCTAFCLGLTEKLPSSLLDSKRLPSHCTACFSLMVDSVRPGCI